MTAPVTATSLRKAAIVLASLDAERADELIDQMPAERASQVRRALVDLDPLDPAEQAQVVGEFLRQGQATKQADLAGVEIEAGLAKQLEFDGATYEADRSPLEPAAVHDATASENRAEVGEAELFSFLHQLDAEELAEGLESERPQTLAVVVAYLPSERSADLLARLPGETQAEVLRRISDLGELDPEMVREVERGLRHRLAEQTAGPRSRRRGPGAVASILQAAGHDARRQMLESLLAHQPALAARFAPPQAIEPSLPFDDLAQLSELALAKIFAECDSHVLVLALAGAHPSFARRVLDQLPARDGRRLRRQLDGLGPTRLSDVERAQHDVAAIARRLHAEGRIELAARRALSLTI